MHAHPHSPGDPGPALACPTLVVSTLTRSKNRLLYLSWYPSPLVSNVTSPASCSSSALLLST